MLFVNLHQILLVVKIHRIHSQHMESSSLLYNWVVLKQNVRIIRHRRLPGIDHTLIVLVIGATELHGILLKSDLFLRFSQ